MANNFQQLKQTIYVTENPKLIQVQNDSNIAALEEEIESLQNEKISENCANLYQRLEDVSDSEVKIENNKIIYTAKQNKKEIALKTEKDLINCLNKVNDVVINFQSRIGVFVYFRNFSFEKCLNRCELDKNSSQADCIKDCYNFGISNTKTINNLVTDELLKCQSELKRL